MTLGLATYGYKIMQAIGVELVAITPSRGYCIELGAAFVIIYGSSQGWPLRGEQPGGRPGQENQADQSDQPPL